jgi:hypothetical protein
MLDVMFDVPSNGDILAIRITRQTVLGEGKPLIRRKSDKAAANRGGLTDLHCGQPAALLYFARNASVNVHIIQAEKFIADNVRSIPRSGIRDFFDIVQGMKDVIRWAWASRISLRRGTFAKRRFMRWSAAGRAIRQTSACRSCER